MVERHIGLLQSIIAVAITILAYLSVIKECVEFDVVHTRSR